MAIRYKKYIIRLSADERQMLSKLACSGKAAAKATTHGGADSRDRSIWVTRRWRSTTGDWEARTYDLAYCLFGETTIPALSTWSAVALALLLMVAGTVVFRRKAAA